MFNAVVCTRNYICVRGCECNTVVCIIHKYAFAIRQYRVRMRSRSTRAAERVRERPNPSMMDAPKQEENVDGYTVFVAPDLVHQLR